MKTITQKIDTLIHHAFLSGYHQGKDNEKHMTHAKETRQAYDELVKDITKDIGEDNETINSPVVIVHNACDADGQVLCEHVIMVPPEMETASKTIMKL